MTYVKHTKNCPTSIFLQYWFTFKYKTMLVIFINVRQTNFLILSNNLEFKSVITTYQIKKLPKDQTSSSEYKRLFKRKSLKFKPSFKEKTYFIHHFAIVNLVSEPRWKSKRVFRNFSIRSVLPQHRGATRKTFKNGAPVNFRCLTKMLGEIW